MQSRVALFERPNQFHGPTFGVVEGGHARAPGHVGGRWTVVEAELFVYNVARRHSMGKRRTRVIVVFDGEVLRPEEPLNLEPNAQYIITIQPKPADAKAGNTWDVLERLTGTVEAPPDWSTEHDHYLYGVPKREDK